MRLAQCTIWGTGQGTLNWLIYWDTFACKLVTLRLGGLLLWGYYSFFCSTEGLAYFSLSISARGTRLFRGFYIYGHQTMNKLDEKRLISNFFFSKMLCSLSIGVVDSQRQSGRSTHTTMKVASTWTRTGRNKDGGWVNRSNTLALVDWGCLSRDSLPGFLEWSKMLRRHAQMSHVSCAYCGALPRKNKACSNTNRTTAVEIGGRGSVFVTISPCFAFIIVAFVDTYK